MRQLPFLFVAVAVAAIAGCATPRALVAGSGAKGSGDYAASIDDEVTWRSLAARPDSAALASTEVVKLIVDTRDGATYFLQSERWPIHYDFARTFLSTARDPVYDQATFNRVEYHTPKRRFVLGTVSRYPGSVWAFELVASDELDLDATSQAFNIVKGRVFFGDRLRYRPVPPAHDADPRTRTLLPVVETAELFANVRYQPLELGESFGYLRVLAPGVRFEPSSLHPFDIVVVGTLPDELPVVSGVISSELQAPLGHINVLCHDRHTPNMALRDATTRPEIVALAGKLVRLVVGPQSFSVEAASQSDAERSWQKRRPGTWTKPPRDDAYDRLPSLAEMTRNDIPRVGAKAAQLGVVTAIHDRPFAVPRGFALPMHAYLRFLVDNGFDRRITTLLADAKFQSDPEVRKPALDALRADMEKAPIPDDVLRPLVNRIHELLPVKHIRLRSSANAEDLPGFNGAGLYRSVRVDPNDPADLARGLRAVWSSVWGWGAFEERQYHRIDSATVGMAILVQESIDDDAVVGVAVTANPFNQGQPAFFINAQLSSGSVTSAHGDEVPEQVLAFHFEDNPGFERLSLSSRAAGKPILSSSEIAALSAALMSIHIAFGGDPLGVHGKSADVEFLLAGADRHVVIVQARPYQVVWTGDRRWVDSQGRPVGGN